MATNLSDNIRNLATRAGSESKALRTLINGNAQDLSALTTTAKGNLVLAINEVNAASKAAARLNDLAASNTTVYSSQKTDAQIKAAIDAVVGGAPAALDTLRELADALGEQSDVSAITKTLATKANSADVGDTSRDFVAVFESALTA